MTAHARRKLETSLPALKSATYELTSPATHSYNCIAWAAGDDSCWWWPSSFFPGSLLGGSYWPRDVPPKRTLDNFELAFKRLGYRRCENGDLEDETEKIAIYADAAGLPTHAARQLSDGRWASKCGEYEDIIHDTPDAVAGEPGYGAVAIFMRRKQAARPHPRALNQ